MIATTQTREDRRGVAAGDDVAQLVARAAGGDEVAWSALVDELGALVWGVTRSHHLSPADAADVTQTTWMRLFENLDRIHDPRRLRAWLWVTARRECLAVISRASRVIPGGDHLPDVASDAPHPVERLSRQHTELAVRGALQRLRPRDRALLRLLVSDPAPTYDEIGARLGMPIGSIGPTRARALARLRVEAERAGLTAEAA
jgi:RNA polymerase sigma factor (sigma-70 family)